MNKRGRLNTGFTLIETMIAGAIGVGVILAISQGILNMNKQVKQVQLGIDYNSIINDLDFRFRTPGVCRVVMTGHGLKFDPGASESRLKLFNDPNPGAVVIFDEGTVINGWRVTKFRASPLVPLPTPSPGSPPVIFGGGTYSALVDFRAERADGSFGGTAKTRTFMLRITVDAKREITDCYSTDSLIVQACAAFGATYEAGRCMFNGKTLLELIQSPSDARRADESSLSSLCRSMGGEWDNVGKYCRPYALGH